MAGPELLETGWTRESMAERCRALRGTLLRDGAAESHLDAMAPGGARNPTADPFGAVVVWYALLRAEWELGERRKVEEAARAEAAVAAALSGTPVPVQLSVAGPGVPIAVYPKSYHALRYCDALDAALREVVALAQSLSDSEVHAHAVIVETLAVRVWAWILTSPEPGLPFDEMATGVEPPEWTGRLTPDDLLRLLEAHLEANRLRVARIAQLFPPERQHESRLSLSGFLGTVAQELHQRPYGVLRHWSVGETFAQAAVAAQSAREARAAAEAEARDRRPS
jgi:hypothetical protein